MNKGNAKLSIGMDMGTTTVSAVVYDVESKKQIEAHTVSYDAYVCTGARTEQTVDTIIEEAKRLLFGLLDSYGEVVSIGLTGQMHGIVYIDKDGNAVSNLINWQDKRADKVLEGGKSTCQIIEQITGEKISTGYGIATHYYNLLMNDVPGNAVGFCSIMDLFGMKICNKKAPITHTSVGASFGLFDLERGDFKNDKLALLGIDRGFLPRLTDKSLSIGECRGVPVYAPIGDNQASFLGSVGEDTASVLVNVGTGSQVSMISDYTEIASELELRPFVNGKYLVCGSALCGGYAYSVIEGFFRSYTVSAGMEQTSQYEVMNRLAMQAYEAQINTPRVDTSFFGTRANPDKRGSVTGIDAKEFTPSAFVLGVLKGMCNELCELYAQFPARASRVVASGGAIRKNEVLRRLVSDALGMKLTVSEAKEEAAIGAAIFPFCRPKGE